MTKKFSLFFLRYMCYNINEHLFINYNKTVMMDKSREKLVQWDWETQFQCKAGALNHGLPVS